MKFTIDKIKQISHKQIVAGKPCEMAKTTCREVGETQAPMAEANGVMSQVE